MLEVDGGTPSRGILLLMSSSPPRSRREFSPDFKADAVRIVTELGRSRAQVARELDINKSTLGR